MSEMNDAEKLRRLAEWVHNNAGYFMTHSAIELPPINYPDLKIIADKIDRIDEVINDFADFVSSDHEISSRYLEFEEIGGEAPAHEVLFSKLNRDEPDTF